MSECPYPCPSVEGADTGIWGKMKSRGNLDSNSNIAKLCYNGLSLHMNEHISVV